MQRSLIRLGTVLVLLICLWGHVAELFDTWDHTLQTGSDIEYSSVIVALAVGAIVVVAAHALSLFRERSISSRFVSVRFGIAQLFLSTPVLLTPSPPLLPLLI
jgi:multisubunit Na+/H+ antiporter MnhB subunit